MFVLHAVEGLSAEEVAEIVGAPPETVRTRLFRARRKLREDLGPEMRQTLETTLPFAGVDCDMLTGTLLDRLAARGLIRD